MSDSQKSAVIIGAGIGGISLAIRLQAAGYDTTIVEALDKPGGRAYVLEMDGYTFDMGPTVLTVPHFIEELFALERGGPQLDEPDFPPEILPKTSHATELRIRDGISGGPHTSRYVEIRPILPFYRIYFDDHTYFDYDGDPESTRRQIEAIEPADLEGYERFHKDARAIFERGFLELGYTYFNDAWTMIKVIPDLMKLDAVRSLFGFTSRYFKSDKLRQVFSFETLLVGGNPLRVPAIYAMIHFVEKTWGIHFAMGGTGALVAAMITKFEELGGTLRCDANVTQIVVDETRTAKGVQVGDEVLHADVVVSNADYGHTYMKLIDPKYRRWNPDWKVKMMQYSMSLVVIYFGFKKVEGEVLDLQHHNIILGPRYEELLKDIFERKILADDFSQYLHIPTLTDPSLAPEGHHAAYTLIPVPHLGGTTDWEEMGPIFVDKILTMLDEENYIPNLRERLTVQSSITPNHFVGRMQSWLGNAFGVEPRLEHSAFFRPHNRSEDIKNLYMVGASAQPGAGTPSVMMSAKMTARAIVEDHGLPL
ncbi:MAG: phytoene desaturase family protein [Myxococcota bacterium]